MSGDVISDGKKTQRVVVWVDDQLELQLLRLANHDARTLSEFVRVVLLRHVYGHAAVAAQEQEGASRAE